jgi:hypothetical protein
VCAFKGVAGCCACQHINPEPDQLRHQSRQPRDVTARSPDNPALYLRLGGLLGGWQDPQAYWLLPYPGSRPDVNVSATPAIRIAAATLDASLPRLRDIAGALTCCICCSLPNVKSNRVAMLFNPATAPYAEYWLNPFKAAAASFAVQAIVAPVHDKSGSPRFRLRFD